MRVERHTPLLREWTRVTALEKTGLEPCNCAGCRKAPWKSEHNVVLAGGWEKGDNSLKSEDCVLVGVETCALRLRECSRRRVLRLVL